MTEKPIYPPDPVQPCPECQMGHLHRRYTAYYTWLGEELITVPDFPTWVCDICGRREYDTIALTRLSMILSPDAGQPASNVRSVRGKQHPKTKQQRPSQIE